MPLNPTEDNITGWIGTYNGTVAGSNNINRVIVAKVNDSVVSMQLQTIYSGNYLTYVNLYNVALNTTTNASINETGLIAGYIGTYQFSGSAVLSGNNLTVSGTGTNVSNSFDVKPYYFSGSK